MSPAYGYLPLLADRTKRARRASHCALDNCWINIGTRIGRLPDGRWAAITCIARASHPDPRTGEHQ
jgi:hypothetical protein